MRRRLHATLLVLTMLVACGEDSGPRGNDPSGSGDQDAGVSDGGSGSVDAADPCEGITCSDQGTCSLGLEGEAVCVCGAGFAPTDDPDCVPGNAPPVFANLPTRVGVAPSAPGSFEVEASDPEGGAVTIAIESTDCDFEPELQAGTTISWLCSALPQTCEIIVGARDAEGASTSARLEVSCNNVAPTFRSAPPSSRLEGEGADYTVECFDEEGDSITVSVAETDTCGGTIERRDGDDVYTRAFTEEDGGTFCTLAVTCSDGFGETTQEILLEVVETNEAPTLDTLPAAASTKWGDASTFQVDASDADVPEQALTFALGTSDCQDVTASVDASGLLSYTCGPPETCSVGVVVTDDAPTPASFEAALALDCTNQVPTVSDVEITPRRARPGDVLTCAYTFADADSDADASTFQWFVNGAPVPLATTSTLGADFGAGDQVRCEVTPADGSGQTGAAASDAIDVLGARALFTFGSQPAGRVEFDGKLHFGAQDLAGDSYLWATDGTIQGSGPVAPMSAAPMGVVASTLVLSATVDAAIGRELYAFDEMTSSLALLKDLNAATNSNPSSQGVVNGVLYFTAFDTATGLELYATDGTSAGTTLLVDAFAGNGPGSGRQPTALGASTIFHATTGFGQDQGSALYVTDGTTGGTTSIATLGSGFGHGVLTEFTELNGFLYFVGSEPGAGAELWRTDGTGANTALVFEAVAGIDDGLSSSRPVVFGAGLALVSAGGELLETDAALTSASPLVDVNPMASDDIQNLVSTPTGLYFFANDGARGYELHHVDAAGALTRTSDAVPGSGGLPGDVRALADGGVAFEVTQPNGDESLWVSLDGTTQNTFEIFSDSSQNEITIVDSIPGAVYFTTRFGANYRLYVHFY